MDAKHSLGEPRVLISRSALLHNAAVVRRAVGPGVKICAIIKADAYGHGAEIVVDTFCNFESASQQPPVVDALAVASIDEAEALPAVNLPVLIFRPVENVYIGRQRSRLEVAIRAGWTLTVCSAAAAEDLNRIAMGINKRASVQVMIDTGMSRSGVPLGLAQGLLESIAGKPALKLAGIASHFASSEDPDQTFTKLQLRRFLSATESFVASGKPVRHVANSGGVFFVPESRLDMVRPGLALYGIDPTCKPNLDRPLRPVMKWTAPLIGIRQVPAGASVGYGQTWTAPHETRLGLVPVGYADGYLRAFGNRAVMIVAGKPVPVVGRVSMDLVTIDVTQIPHIQVGEEVTILDNDPLSPASVYELARLAETIPYEIFCRIGQRIHRVAVEPEESSVGQRGDVAIGDA